MVTEGDIEEVGEADAVRRFRVRDKEIGQVNHRVSKPAGNLIVRTREREIYISQCGKRHLCFKDERMPAELSKISKSRKLLPYICVRVADVVSRRIDERVRVSKTGVLKGDKCSGWQ